MPRLRGEVDGLRRENVEVIENARLLAAAVNQQALDENAALTEAIEITREAHEKRQNLFQIRQTIVKGAYASMLHQALMAVAEANGGRYPDNMHAAFEHLGSKMYHEGLEIDDKSISATDFEIVYQGSIQGIQDRQNTALFRETIPFGIGGGKAVRTVYFANGRGESVEENLLPSGELEVKRPRDPSADYE